MLDGVTSAPGGIDGNGIQVGKQFAEITAISAYSFIVSCALLYILKYIPGMHLRVTEEVEMQGLDIDQFFDEQIGDWGMFDELSRRKMEMEISSWSLLKVQTRRRLRRRLDFVKFKLLYTEKARLVSQFRCSEYRLTRLYI
jgi:Amt family ammonium transporter